VHVLALPLAYIYARNVLLLANRTPDSLAFKAFLDWARTSYSNVYFIGGGGTELLSREVSVEAVDTQVFQIPEWESARNALPTGARKKEFDFSTYRFLPPAAGTTSKNEPPIASATTQTAIAMSAGPAPCERDDVPLVARFFVYQPGGRACDGAHGDLGDGRWASAAGRATRDGRSRAERSSPRLARGGPRPRALYLRHTARGGYRGGRARRPLAPEDQHQRLAAADRHRHAGRP